MITKGALRNVLEACVDAETRVGSDGVRRVPIAGVSLSLKRRSGATLPVEVSTAPLKGAEGKDLGVVAVVRDLTLVRELESRLRRSDRLATLGSLAAGLAHEIKNPLTSVLTFIAVSDEGTHRQ